MKKRPDSGSALSGRVLFCTAGWKSLWARRHLQLIVNVLNLFSLMLNGLAE